MFLGIHLDEDSGLRNDSSPRSIQPPINRRGLSKYYHGKSQSFTSMSEVTCVEDLAKYRRGMKSCKSFGGELDVPQEPSLPAGSRNSSRVRPNKGSRGSCASSVARPPPIPMQKNF